MSDRYASLDVPQLSRIATERGIECPQLGEAPQEDRELLALLLRAYDAGRAAAAGEARERPPSPDALGGDELRAEVALQIEVLEVLRTLSSLPGHRGIDIGDILHVGPRRRGRLRRGQPQRTLVTLYSVLAARWRILQSLIESDFGQTVVGKQPSRLGRVHVSGGGACKYPPLFLNAMGLSIEPVKELRAMVEGLLFLQETSAGSRRNDDPQGDLYTVDQDPCCPWPVEGRERGEKEQ
ncbi:unnamed protein product [Prorocentrum cordatum]|uniref:Uncharacterized protein n=1 Tax=Prorocentrum cordatum TaxID=2364126 RepID=A0ABN9PZ26_9DINO|nr:unnamed protein product [Polarella glacialis]